MSEADTTPRLGVVVARKVDRSAVERNRIRRLIRESFRRQQSELLIHDYVVRVRPEAARQTSADLRASLDELWKRFKSK